MNKIYLIGEIVTDINFKFIINSKNISIAIFKIKTIRDNQIILIKCYNEMADYFYSKHKKGDVVMLEGRLENDAVVIKVKNTSWQFTIIKIKYKWIEYMY